MKYRLLFLAIAVWIWISPVWAGDDASGPTPFSVDLSAPYHTYTMSPADRKWSKSLVRNLRYHGRVIHFVRTDLKLSIEHEDIQGEVYQALERTKYFYVAAGDAMLIIGAAHPYGPGVNGFSMHRSKSGGVIVCLNLSPGGVPMRSGTTIIKGVNAWKGNLWSRFQ